MDEYLKLKVECCEQQTQEWDTMIKNMKKQDIGQHLINYSIERKKDVLYKYFYPTLMQSLETIPDIYFVNDEFSRMFEKMVELARFNGNPALDSNITRHFKLRDRSVTDWRSSMGTPAFTMALMGPGDVGIDDLASSAVLQNNWSSLYLIQVLYFGKEVTEIEEAMCDGMQNLRGVYFHPNTNCEIIGEAAFQNCRSLKRIIIPDNVENLKEACFAHCNKMSQVVIGKKVETLGDSVFWRCDKLNDIHIPDSVKFIGNECFKILHPGGLPTKLGLRAITGMKNVEELGHSVFLGSDLAEIRLGSKLRRIGYNCFSYTPLKTLTIEYNQSLMIDRNSASFSAFPNAFNNLNNLVTVNLRGGNPIKWIQKLKGQFTDCKEIHRLSVGWREQIAKIRTRNDFEEDVSDEVIYIAYARILEQEAAQLMKLFPTDITRYIAEEFSPSSGTTLRLQNNEIITFNGNGSEEWAQTHYENLEKMKPTYSPTIGQYYLLFSNIVKNMNEQNLHIDDYYVLCPVYQSSVKNKQKVFQRWKDEFDYQIAVTGKAKRSEPEDNNRIITTQREVNEELNVSINMQNSTSDSFFKKFRFGWGIVDYSLPVTERFDLPDDKEDYNRRVIVAVLENKNNFNNKHINNHYNCEYDIVGYLRKDLTEVIKMLKDDIEKEINNSDNINYITKLKNIQSEGYI